MSNALLQRAIRNILACPACKQDLFKEKGANYIECISCSQRYPIVGGIPLLICGDNISQDDEKEYRNRLAAKNIDRDESHLLQIIENHHSIPAMQHYAKSFYNKFDQETWVCDIGIGWGWHWRGLQNACKVVGIDLSL